MFDLRFLDLVSLYYSISSWIKPSNITRYDLYPKYATWGSNTWQRWGRKHGTCGIRCGHFLKCMFVWQWERVRFCAGATPIWEVTFNSASVVQSLSNCWRTWTKLANNQFLKRSKKVTRWNSSTFWLYNLREQVISDINWLLCNIIAHCLFKGFFKLTDIWRI